MTGMSTAAATAARFKLEIGAFIAVFKIFCKRANCAAQMIPGA